MTPSRVTTNAATSGASITRPPGSRRAGQRTSETPNRLPHRFTTNWAEGPIHRTSVPGTRCRFRFVMALAALGLLLGAACTGGDTGAATPVLGWYINPDNGGQAELAEACTKAAGGRYRISVSTLPNDASGQREQLVRRLAAKDRSIAVMSLDPPFVAEFAEAGFLREFDASEARAFTDGVLAGPVESATWEGRLVAAPFYANSQLLWYRKKAAARAGVDPSAGPVSWEQLVAGSEK